MTRLPRLPARYARRLGGGEFMRPSANYDRKGSTELHAGRRPDLDNRHYRSKWEANIARYLRFLQERGEIRSWAPEVKYYDFPIRHGTTRYLPDFEVTTNNGSLEVWEVKGYMDRQSNTKIKRFMKYYPHIKLRLIQRPEYAEIACKLGPMIPGWEK